MDHTMDAVIRNITEIFTKQGKKPPVPITEQTDLFQNLQFDKAQEAELLCNLEKEFGVRFPGRLPKPSAKSMHIFALFLPIKSGKPSGSLRSRTS